MPLPGRHLPPAPLVSYVADKGEGIFQMQTSALFGAKNIVFFLNLWCVRTDMWGRRLRQCGYVLDKGRGGQFLAIFCGYP